MANKRMCFKFIEGGEKSNCKGNVHTWVFTHPIQQSPRTLEWFCWSGPRFYATNESWWGLSGGSEQRHILFKGNPGWLWMDGRSWGWCGHWGLNFILHETRSCFLTFDGRNSQFGSKSAFWGGHNLSTCSWKRVVSCALWVCGVAQEHPAEGEGQKTH